MSASNYLPPFDAGGRTGGTDETDAAGTEPAPTAASAVPGAASGVRRTDAEVTYADFLGDQVED